MDNILTADGFEVVTSCLFFLSVKKVVCENQ